MLAKAIEHYRKAFAGLPSGVWAIALVLLVHRSGTMVLPFLSLHLKDHLGLSATTAALLLSLYGIGAVIGSIFGGYLTGWFGPIRVMLGSLLLAAPIYVLLLYSHTLEAAAVAIFLLSCVGDCVRPAAMTATGDLCPPDAFSRAYAFTRLAVNLGMSIGPAIAGFLYLHYFAWIFYIDALTCVLAAGLVWYLFGWKAPAQNRNSIAEIQSNSVSVAKRPSVLKDTRLLLVLGLYSFVAMIFLQTIGVYPIYLREQLAITEATIGLLFSVNTILIVLFEMVLIAALDSRGKLPLIGLGSVFICVGFGIMPFGSNIGFIGLTVVLWTVGEMLSMPILTAWVGQRAPQGMRGRYMGAISAMFSIAWVVAPVLGGGLYAIHPSAIWYWSLVVAVIVAIGFRRLALSEPNVKTFR
jgi:MFS family permease